VKNSALHIPEIFRKPYNNSTRKIPHCKQLASTNSRQNITSNSTQCAKFSSELFSFLSSRFLKLFSLMLYLSSKHQLSVVEEQEEDAK
jgi:hypothetical protein